MTEPAGYRRSQARVRRLTAGELGLSQRHDQSYDIPSSEIRELATPPWDDSSILKEGIGKRVAELIKDGFGAIVLVGPPGTGKSFHAEEISLALVQGDTSRRRVIQFHQSYEYEDFVEGFVPRETGDFELVDKHLIVMCNIASSFPDRLCLLVIEELSRANVARVFGEALTYLEPDKREQEFYLASNSPLVIPNNLLILATMNSFDRGVEDLDLALERRFARIEVPADPDLLLAHLESSKLGKNLAEGIVRFFRWLQQNPNRLARIGHAWFFRLRDADALSRRWEHQLKPYFDRVFESDPKGRQEVDGRWNREVGSLLEQSR